MSKVFRIWSLLLIATVIIGAWTLFDWCAAALTAISAVYGWWLRDTKEAPKETEDESK